MKNSPYTDNELLEIASGFKNHFRDHFSTINDQCPELNHDFFYRFKALYYEAQTPYNSGSEDERIIQQYTADLVDFADHVKSLFLIFRFYLQKAFPYSWDIWEQYEYCEFEEAIHDFARLRECLEKSVHLIKEKYNELTAVNCPVPTLNEIVTLTSQICEKHDLLLERLKNKASNEENNKTNLNDLFEIMMQIDDAAHRCLQNEPELRNQLTFP